MGWLGVLGWQSAVATVTFLSATNIVGIVILNHPEYQLKHWHVLLLMWAVLALCILCNTFFSRQLPLIEGTIVILHVFGFFAILVGDNA